jgi:AraC family transcriptional regulator
VGHGHGKQSADRVPARCAGWGVNRWVSSLRAVRYRPSSKMAAHHHDEATLCLVLSGRYQDRIRGQETEHRRGDLLFCPPFEDHAQSFSSHGAFKLLMQPTGEALDYIADRRAFDRASFVGSHRLAAIGAQLAAELRAPDPSSGIIVEGLVAEMLGFVVRSTFGSSAGPSRTMRAAKDYIAEHACTGLTLDQIAAAVGCEALGLSGNFRRTYGLSVGEYLRRVRLDRAAERLAGGTTPLAVLASECGFYDQAHFTRAFKAAYGLPPGRYRATLQ